jgi:uncharacterized protein (TIGR00297 family)
VRRWVVAAALGAVVAGFAYARRTLTLDGALGAALLGCVVFARGGLPAAGALLAFFGSSSGLSRLGEQHKQGSALAQVKGARRDLWQVLANGAFAALSIGLGGRTHGSGGFLGALAAAGADTWATELGMLAHSAPRLLTTLEPVEAGTSGGVTLQGLAASVGGAACVGLSWSVLGGGWRALPTALVAGTVGAVFDSLVGATVQALYRCPTCAVLTEAAIHPRCGQRALLVRGWPWMTNDTVNACATLVGAGIGTAVWRRCR